MPLALNVASFAIVTLPDGASVQSPDAPQRPGCRISQSRALARCERLVAQLALENFIGARER
jgi:hypothetical protein